MNIGARLPAFARRPSRGHEKGLTLWQSFFFTVLVSLFLVVFLLYRQREWEQRGQRAVLVVHEQEQGVRQRLTLVVADPIQSDIHILPLPEKQYVVTAIARYGAYQTDALAGLTLLEGLDWEFLEQSLSREYGVVIDGIFWTHESEIKSDAGVRGLAWQGILNRVNTTLSYWDRWTWWRLVRSVPSYQVELAKTEDWVDAEGRLRTLAYESWAEKKIQDEQIRQSGIAVVVQNGSQIQGEANRVARMLRIVGYAVRNIDTIDPQENTKIVLSQTREEKSEIAWAVSRLKELYPQATVEENTEVAQRARADIVLVIGKNQEGSFTLRRP